MDSPTSMPSHHGPEKVGAAKRSLPITSMACKYIKNAPPSDVDLPWDLMPDINLRELLAYFPNHCFTWPGLSIVLLQTGWTQATIAENVNHVRALNHTQEEKLQTRNNIGSHLRALRHEHLLGDTWRASNHNKHFFQSNEALNRILWDKPKGLKTHAAWPLWRIANGIVNPPTGRFTERVQAALRENGSPMALRHPVPPIPRPLLHNEIHPLIYEPIITAANEPKPLKLSTLRDAHGHGQQLKRIKTAADEAVQHWAGGTHEYSLAVNGKIPKDTSRANIINDFPHLLVDDTLLHVCLEFGIAQVVQRLPAEYVHRRYSPRSARKDDRLLRTSVHKANEAFRQRKVSALGRRARLNDRTSREEYQVYEAARSQLMDRAPRKLPAKPRQADVVDREGLLSSQQGKGFLKLPTEALQGDQTTLVHQYSASKPSVSSVTEFQLPNHDDVVPTYSSPYSYSVLNASMSTNGNQQPQHHKSLPCPMQSLEGYTPATVAGSSPSSRFPEGPYLADQQTTFCNMSEAKFSDLLDTYLRDPYAQELASSPSNLPDASSEMSSQCDTRKVSDGGPQPAPPPGIFGDKTISEVDIQHADLVLKCSLFQLPASSRVTLEKPNAPREDHAQEVVYSPVADQHAFEISNRSYNANLQGLAVDESQTMYRNGLVYFSGSQMEEQLRSQPQESRLRRFEHSKDQSKGGLQAVAEALGTEAPSTDTPFFAYQSSPGRTECLVVEQQQPHAPLPKSPEANSSGRDAIPWDEPSRPVANRRAPFDQSRADPPLRDLSSSFALKEYFDFSGTAALDI